MLVDDDHSCDGGTLVVTFLVNIVDGCFVVTCFPCI